jgi:hypothetical protein
VLGPDQAARTIGVTTGTIIGIRPERQNGRRKERPFLFHR